MNIKNYVMRFTIISLCALGAVAFIMSMEQPRQDAYYRKYTDLPGGKQAGWLYIPKFNDWVLITLNAGEQPYLDFQTGRANFVYANPDILLHQNPHGLYFWWSQMEQAQKQGQSLILGNSTLRTAVRNTPYSPYVVFNDQYKQYLYTDPQTDQIFSWDPQIHVEHEHLLPQATPQIQPLQPQPLAPIQQTTPAIPAQKQEKHEVIFEQPQKIIPTGQKTVIDWSDNVAKQHRDNLCGRHAFKNANALLGWINKEITKQQRDTILKANPTGNCGNLDMETIYRLITDNTHLNSNNLTVIDNIGEMARNNFRGGGLRNFQLKTISNTINAIANRTPGAYAFIFANADHYTDKQGILRGGYDHWIAIVVEIKSDGSLTYHYADSIAQANSALRNSMIANLEKLLSQNPAVLHFDTTIEPHLLSIETALNAGNIRPGLLSDIINVIINYKITVQPSLLQNTFIQDYLPRLFNILKGMLLYTKNISNNAENAHQTLNAIEPILPFIFRYMPQAIENKELLEYMIQIATRYEDQSLLNILLNIP